MQTIAIVNRKGGSGKTTTVNSLAGAYSKQGMRALAIDLDPQADLSSALAPGDPDDLPIEATAAVLFEDRYVSPDRLVKATAFPNLFLVPCSELLRPASRLEEVDYARRQFALRAFLKDVAHQFDRVLIDTPPDLGFCAWSALCAADFALTPVQANPKGYRGLSAVNGFIRSVRDESANPELVQLGYVRTVYEARKSVHQIYSARIAKHFPGLLLEEAFPKAAQFEEADTARQPISVFRPRSQAAKAVERIMQEIERRIGRRAELQDAA